MQVLWYHIHMLQGCVVRLKSQLGKHRHTYIVTISNICSMLLQHVLGATAATLTTAKNEVSTARANLKTKWSVIFKMIELTWKIICIAHLMCSSMLEPWVCSSGLNTEEQQLADWLCEQHVESTRWTINWHIPSDNCSLTAALQNEMEVWLLHLVRLVSFSHQVCGEFAPQRLYCVSEQQSLQSKSQALQKWQIIMTFWCWWFK